MLLKEEVEEAISRPTLALQALLRQTVIAPAWASVIGGIAAGRN